MVDPAIEVMADRDLKPHTAGATGLRADLADACGRPRVAGVVACDDASLFVTEDGIEVDSPEGHEGTGRVARRAREGRVVLDPVQARLRFGV